MSDEDNIVLNRKLNLCPTTEDWPVSDLVQECPECEDFLLHCCTCYREQSELPSHLSAGVPCHHYRVVFTDGACMNNGQSGAKAGVGVAYGNKPDTQMSLPITDSEDDFPLRSNQRAELYAAKLGLELLAEHDRIENEEPDGRSKGGSDAWIIATDSEYVANGMTAWLPRWKRNGWVTSNGTKPANLDLFLSLDALMRKHEAPNIKIGFWRIPREDNELADRLAKDAAALGDVATVTSEKRKPNGKPSSAQSVIKAR